jgi:orotidine-5'-phosphate decarboxylase
MSNKTYTLIPALDVVDLDVALRLVCRTAGRASVYGYKLGFSLGLGYGLPEAVRRIREWTDKPLIYDHQKAATDIPDTGALFGDVMKKAGIDEVILFPHTGPRTLEAWTRAMQERNLKVIVGAVMTHPAYLVSEGGFIADEAAARAYRQAAGLGVSAFVVPLTKPDLVAALAADVPFTADQEFYSPGFGAQGGDPAQFPALKTHRLIMGRSLLAAEDPVKELGAIEERLGICSKMA